ncbi:MAG: ferrous iron transport protein A [Akkermansia sp.]|nr:ferrous iron transport protein A [Akkermansia sp.]
MNSETQKNLSAVAIGHTARVCRVHGSGALRRRLLDMGITRGTEITLLKVAPLGDPLEVSLRGFTLSLRRAEAAMVETKTETETHP